MNSDLNIATRRLLQVVLDMLSNPNHAQQMDEREQKQKAGERVYDIPSPYRCDLIAVEAAFRAAREAQQMLRDAAIDVELAREPAKRPLNFDVDPLNTAATSADLYKEAAGGVS